MKKGVIGFFVGAVVTLLAAVAAWLMIVYTGAYNVAATDPHFDAARWTLDTTMRRSVANRAEAVELPGTLSDNLIAKGAEHYTESCAHCHGGPGQEPAAWSRSMRPEPPHLAKAAAEWEPEEIHWIIENGIKMSGMPAFGAHHEQEEIVALTAFVTKLPGLTPEGYASLTGGEDGGGREHGGESATEPAAEPNENTDP